MTTGKEKSPSPPKPGATAAQRGQEQSVGPLTQLLIKSRQRIVDPRRWSRGAYARDAKANPVNVMDPAAVCWCAVGSLERECNNPTPTWDPVPGVKLKPNPLYHAAHALLEQGAALAIRAGAGGYATAEQKKTHSITAVNDGSGHAQVLVMYNKAIGLAKGK